MTDLEELKQRLRDAGLSRWEHLLLRDAEPAIGLVPHDGGPARTGTSKLGGDPDLPAGFEWPRYGEVPLSFVMQVDLAAAKEPLPASPLPSSGLLSFFYEGTRWGFDPKDRGSARVHHFASGTPLTRTPPPPGPERRRFLGLGRRRQDARRF